MEHSATLTALATALALAQGELKAVSKTGKSNYGKFVELGAALEHVLPILSKQGLAVTQIPILMDDGTTGLVTMLLHKSGEWMKSTYPVRMQRTTPQGQGSAITYARRYALMAIVGIAGDDDDGEAGSAGNSPEQRQAAAPKAEGPGKASKAQITMMMTAAKRASGLEARNDIIDFFIEEIGKEPTEVLANEAGAVIKTFTAANAQDDEVSV
jgi:hypothetical protein